MSELKDLLINPGLSSEQFDKALEYLYWEKKEQFSLERYKIDNAARQNEQMAQPRRSATRSAAPPQETYADSDEESERGHRNSAVMPEDLEFNHATSYGALGDSYAGKLCKTKLWNITKSVSEKVFNDHKQVMKQVFPGIDRVQKIRPMLQQLLLASSLAHRADRWSYAKDISFLKAAKDEIDLKLLPFTDEQLVAGINFLQERWGSICPSPDISYNSTLLCDRLDAAFEKQALMQQNKELYDVIKSPFMVKVLDKYKCADLDKLRERIEVNYLDYRTCVRYEAMQYFRENQPADIDIGEGQEWAQHFPMYIAEFREKLGKDIEVIWKETLVEQLDWEKEYKAAKI